MNGDNERADRLIEEAIDVFLEAESAHIRTHIGERNLCGGLANVLKSKLKAHGFGRYYVDLEYNRMQNGEIKTILDSEYKEVTINCDLIAIEMKKSSRPQAEKDKDRMRLRALTKSSYDDVWSNDGTTHPEHVCGYNLGVYVEIDAGAGKCLLEYYRRGRQVAEQFKKF